MDSTIASDAEIASGLNSLRANGGPNSLANRLRDEFAAPLAQMLAKSLPKGFSEYRLSIALADFAAENPDHFRTLSQADVEKLSATEKLTFANTGKLPLFFGKRGK